MKLYTAIVAACLILGCTVSPKRNCPRTISHQEKYLAQRNWADGLTIDQVAGTALGGECKISYQCGGCMICENDRCSNRPPTSEEYYASCVISKLHQRICIAEPKATRSTDEDDKYPNGFFWQDTSTYLDEKACSACNEACFDSWSGSGSPNEMCFHKCDRSYFCKEVLGFASVDTCIEKFVYEPCRNMSKQFHRCLYF